METCLQRYSLAAFAGQAMSSRRMPLTWSQYASQRLKYVLPVSVSQAGWYSLGHVQAAAMGDSAAGSRLQAPMVYLL